VSEGRNKNTPVGNTLSSNKFEQVIYTRGAQDNSAFHPFGVDNRVVVSARWYWLLK